MVLEKGAPFSNQIILNCTLWVLQELLDDRGLEDYNQLLLIGKSSIKSNSLRFAGQRLLLFGSLQRFTCRRPSHDIDFPERGQRGCAHRCQLHLSRNGPTNRIECLLDCTRLERAQVTYRLPRNATFCSERQSYPRKSSSNFLTPRAMLRSTIFLRLSINNTDGP